MRILKENTNLSKDAWIKKVSSLIDDTKVSVSYYGDPSGDNKKIKEFNNDKVKFEVKGNVLVFTSSKRDVISITIKGGNFYDRHSLGTDHFDYTNDAFSVSIIAD